jgi:hypothetical protein
LHTWPGSCDFGDSHKRAGLSVALDTTTSITLINLSFLHLYTDSTLIYVYFACVVFVAVAVSHVLRSVWVFVLLQFPSHTSLPKTK